VEAAGLTLVGGSFGGRLPDVFPGVPWVLRGRYRDAADPAVTVRGTRADGEPWSVELGGRVAAEPALTSVWARGQVRDLEDRYVMAQGHFGLEEPPDLDRLERRIVETSLAFGVLSRFTAYVAVDERVVTDGAAPHRVIQPVERPAGWAPPSPPPGIAASPPAFARRMVATRADFGPPVAAMSTFAGPAAMAPAAPVAKAGVAGAAAGGPPPAQEEDDLVRQLLDREDRRLTELATAPVARRREALADLASWLVAVSRPAGVPEALWDDLLAALRRAATGSAPQAAEFDTAWSEVLRLIERVLGGGGSASGRARRPTFWKHPRDT